MKFIALFYAVKASNASVLKRHPLLHVAAVVVLAAQVIPNVARAQAQPAPPLSGVLGKVQSFTGSSLDVATPSGVVHVTVTQPLATYKQTPSDLSHVSSASYVGVASVQQADGTELAKQVIIFPKELRGAAEGSVLLDAPGATTRNRVTNGSVSGPAVSHSRMTNGTVQKGGSSTLVVRYQDGSQTISVPADVSVVLVAKDKATLGAGDTIYAATEKLADGTLTTDRGLSGNSSRHSVRFQATCASECAQNVAMSSELWFAVVCILSREHEVSRIPTIQQKSAQVRHRCAV